MTNGGAADGGILLRVSDIVVHFGGIMALDGVSFDQAQGEILGLIGPNGAGKTTLFNCLSRLYTPVRGDIVFNGETLLAKPPHRIAGAGIGRTFQNLASFHRLSVRDNIRIGAHSRSRGDFVSDALRVGWATREGRRIDEIVEELLDYLELGPYADHEMSGLSFGTMKRVELARALASQPKLLLLDEPAGGLNHDEISELGERIRKIRNDRGVTILLVEHHMNLVMAISDTVVVLNFGRKIAQGTPAMVQADPEVIRAYLGDSE